VLLPLGGRPVLEYSLRAFDRAAGIGEIVIVGHDDDRAEIEAIVRGAAPARPVKLVRGGARRIDSVLAGAKATSAKSALVAVHDAARPMVEVETIERALRAAGPANGAVTAVEALDTVKRSKDGKRVGETLPRQEIFLAQTPQVFPRAPFLAALEAAAASGEDFTDDAAVAERAGIPVALAPGEPGNVKITREGDLTRAQAQLAAREPRPGAGFRVGTGFDIHRMEAGRRCVLGGVEIPSERGPAGHSDGDAVLHALGDAILGAAGLDDLGTLFPDTDPRYAGADSRELLRQCAARAREAGFRLCNADCVVVLERPKLAPHRAAIRASIAKILGLDASAVNVKGKTAEGLGALGSGDAVAVQCTVLLQCDAR
jgi:2-C-methyl-D-erythritol 4-phosphate cytidylyltransferase/2-C-methyl-D-erythritol 2,4-cyclodiphosphate synthase